MGDEPESESSKKRAAVEVLEKTISEIIFDKFDECPLLYDHCDGKDTTCIGDLNKFRGCNIFLERYLNSPPAGYKLK